MTDWPNGNSDMARRIREHDWTASALGPIATWPASLRMAVDLVLGSGHAMQLAWGPQRAVLYNDAYAPMLADRHPRALGLPFQQAWPDVWNDIAPLVDRVFAGETVTFQDMPLVMTRRGYVENTWWNFSYSPVRDETGAVVGLLNVTVDATPKQHALQAQRERDEANAHLEQNEARFRALVTAGRNSIYRVSPDWRQLFQLDSQTLTPVKAPIEGWVQQYVPEEDQAEVQRAIDAAVRSKSLFELEHRVRLADGGIGWVQSRAVPLLGPDGEIAEWFGAGTDVTQRALAETALHEANQRKDQFLAILGHELRNGLSPLVYNMRIGNRRADNAAAAKDLFARSDRQLKHLVRLVDDLLDVARISTGKIELDLENLKPRDVADLALDACHADIEAKRHRVQMVDEAGAGLLVRADRVRLTQVMSNLLSNASKYMDQEGSITVRIAREGDQALLEVIDTGIGIPAAALPQVFSLFTQVRDQQAYSAGGLGIGLSLVKQLVEMQGGSVSATSEGSGHGSRFAVRLPVVTTDMASQDPTAAYADAAPPGQGLRVLVVDDQQEAADAMVELLGLQGHEAEAAYGGLQALECARRLQPDLVLLDLNMTGMDGFEVAQHLRSDFPSEPNMRIVALTGRGQEVDRQKTQSAHFDGHLVKPAGYAELLDVLRTPRRSPS